jgi:hypothetical protein
MTRWLAVLHNFQTRIMSSITVATDQADASEAFAVHVHSGASQHVAPKPAPPVPLSVVHHTVVVHHAKSEPIEVLSLVSIRTAFVLVLWYLFSFGAIFLNKYVVDMLHAEIVVFCEYRLRQTFSLDM